MAWALTGRDAVVEQGLRVFGRSAPEGLLLAGAPGVGRSRVLAELADLLSHRSDASVTRVLASEAARSIPFGALAELFPGGPGLDPLARLSDLLRELRDANPSGLPVLVVDDAHLLDDSSVALVHALLTNGVGRAILSVRSDLPMPATISALAKDGYLQRIDLLPLERDAVDDLLATAFPGPRPPSMHEQVWEATAGRPLYIRLVTDAAREAGTLAPDGIGWRWDGWPPDAPALVQLVAERIRDLGPGARSAVELLALGGPLPDLVARAVLCSADQQALEGAGLAVSDDEKVWIEDPLVGSVAAAGLGPATARAHAVRLSEAWRQSDDASSRPEAARWQLEAGLDLDPTEALEAAHDALGVFDVVLAERLARSAVEHQPPTAAAHLLLAEALRGQGRGLEAIAELERALPLATSDDVVARVAVARAETAALILGDLTEALVVLKEASRVVEEPEASHRIAVERTFLGAFAGDFREVVEAADLATSHTVDAETELDVVLAVTFAQALSVQLDGLDERLERGMELASIRAMDSPYAGQQLATSRTLGMLGQGRVASALGTARRELAKARLDGTPTGLSAICVAFAACFTGDLDEATDAGLEAARSAREFDQFGVAGLAASIGAVAALQAGRTSAAELLIAHAGPRAGADLRAQSVIAQRVEAWREAAEGSTTAAAAAAAAGRDSVRASHCLWGAAALHDAVRLGRADLVLSDLRALAAECPSPLIECFVQHADALDARRVESLVAVSSRFHALGCRLFAVEAEAQAAEIAASTGDQAAAARLVTRARLRWATCTGAEPAALARAPAGLSPRQMEVAGIACTGASSRDIAATLVLSVRTVDNHLRQVYRVLEVDSRAELATVLLDE